VNADVARQAVIRRGTDITSWNKGAERVFGYSAGEAIGQPITIVIPEDRQSEEREILTRIRRGERIDHFETNPYLAAAIGVFLAWCATQAVNEWRDRTGFVQYSFIAQRMVHVRR